MERKVDLSSASWDVLIEIITRQQAVIEGLERRIAQLEGQSKGKSSRRMPGLKPKENERPAQPEKFRRTRRQGFARTRMTPIHRVEHAASPPRRHVGLQDRITAVIALGPQLPVQHDAVFQPLVQAAVHIFPVGVKVGVKLGRVPNQVV